MKAYGKRLLLAAVLASVSSCRGEEGRQQDMEGDAATAAVSPVPAVRIVAPTEGQVVAGPDVTVRLETVGLDIVPAGVEQARSGHHHLIVDAPLPPLGEPIPSEPERYIHLGQGQSQYVLEGLVPGEHQVIALVGDYRHVPVEPPVADTVHFVVE